mmetsp:Transcript_8306/g.24964  ORF Transcript_8306/g.24964 Transcript_8306/m.24964 type:complete len:221 (+) Transcript_8306:104-766(+)
MFNLYGDLPAPKAASGNETAPPANEQKDDAVEDKPVEKKSSEGTFSGAAPSSSWAGTSSKLLAPSVNMLKKRKNADLSVQQNPAASKKANLSSLAPVRRKAPSVAKPATAIKPTAPTPSEFPVVTANSMLRATQGDQDDEEYDPLQPNDYETALEEQEKKRITVDENFDEDRRYQFSGGYHLVIELLLILALNFAEIHTTSVMNKPMNIDKLRDLRSAAT